MNRFHNKLNRRTRKQHEGKELNQNATRLKTLLKLPKAHKWVIYEWFYGNLDQSLFKSNQESEFQLCLKEIFPNLKTRNLKRAEWCFIRKLMGKPRRCSPAFFAEERLSLNAKRDKIRQIQHQQKLDNLSNYHDLPKLIPMPLVIGTRVTALQRKPHDGLFNGCVEAVDILNGSYRIAFDRQKVSTETVLDHDIRSIAPTEFMPKKAFLCKSRQINPINMPVYTPAKLMEMINEQISSPFDTTNDLNDQFSDNLSKKNSYPIKFLAQLVKLYKILDFKRRRIYELKVMNNEIEKLISNPDEIVSYEIQKQYANTVLDLDKLNKCLNESLKCVKTYSEDLNLSQKEIHNLNKEQTEASKVVALHSQNKNITKNSVHLISNLIKILVHLKEFNKKEINAEEIKNLNESVLDVKDNLYKTNIESFENNVQIHVNFIQTEANHLGSLGILAQSNSEIYA